MKDTNGKKRVLMCALILIGLAIIPPATAPIWYGSGDDTGLVGRWSCEGNFRDNIMKGQTKKWQNY